MKEILSNSSERAENLFLKLDALITRDLENDVASIFLNKQDLDPIFAHVNRFINL